DPLPQPEPKPIRPGHTRQDASPEPAGERRTRTHHRSPQQHEISGQSSPAGVGDPSGREHLPVLGGHDVPPATRTRPEPAAAGPGHPPAPGQARTGGPRPEPGPELRQPETVEDPARAGPSICTS